MLQELSVPLGVLAADERAVAVQGPSGSLLLAPRSPTVRGIAARVLLGLSSATEGQRDRTEPHRPCVHPPSPSASRSLRLGVAPAVARHHGIESVVTCTGTAPLRSGRASGAVPVRFPVPGQVRAREARLRRRRRPWSRNLHFRTRRQDGRGARRCGQRSFAAGLCATATLTLCAANVRCTPYWSA